MSYKVKSTNPFDWKIEKSFESLGEDCFSTLQEAKDYLIETAESEIMRLNYMINEVRKLNDAPENLDKSYIASIISKIKISDVIKRYVPIKEVGMNFLSDCVFCDAKQSLAISNKRGLCKCFACGRSATHGEIIMSKEKVDAISAIEILKTVN